MSMLQFLTSKMSEQSLKIKSAKMHGDLEDITDQIVDYSTLRDLDTFPTTFYVLATQSDEAFTFKMRLVTRIPIPLAFQMTMARCKRLINTVLSCAAMSLQCVHISQALLHLMVSLIDQEQHEVEDIWRNDEICRIAESFQILVNRLTNAEMDHADQNEIKDQLKQIFNACCGDLPGAVAVRYSYDVYLNMIESDLQDLEYQKHQRANRALKGQARSQSSRRSTLAPIDNELSQMIPGKHAQDPGRLSGVPKVMPRKEENAEKSALQAQSFLLRSTRPSRDDSERAFGQRDNVHLQKEGLLAGLGFARKWLDRYN